MENYRKQRRLATLMLLLLTNLFFSLGYSQSNLPFAIANKSEFPDDQVYVGLVGRVGDVGVWFDCATGTVKNMQLSDNTVPGPTNGGNPGPGGSSMYANCFTKLSNIPNKTLSLPPISSVRIFIAFKSQLFLYFFGNNGGYSAPDLNNPTDPNQGIRYEIIELTYNSIGLWANTTRVDNYQYPMGLEVWGSNIAYQKVGEIKTHQEILDAWVSTVPASFQGCYDANLGIIHAPSKTAAFKEGGSMYSYFNSYVDQIWNRYKNEDLTIGIGDAGNWKGRVQADGQRFVFTRVTDGRVGIVEARPNTQEILEGKGVLAHDVPETPTADDLDVQKHFCAAFNRGAINPNAPAGAVNDWSKEADFFINNSYNQFVKFWHRSDISYEGQTYAFCYDDVFDYSSTIMATLPTKAIITIGGFANSAVQVLTSIVVSPASTNLNLGGTQQFSAIGYDQNGGTMTITPTWTGTNTTALFTATTTGTFTVRAQSGSISGTATVIVSSTPANLALNKPVTVSSIENAGTTGSAAADGNGGTRWSSLASDPQSIMIDLQNTYAINKVVLNWEAAAGKSFQIQVSPDGINNWTSIYTTTTSTGGVQTLNITGTGRFIRMYGTARTTGYGYSLWEFEVYGTNGTNVPVTGVTVSPATQSLVSGNISQLTATVAPANATNKTVSWTSSNAAVATVNATGLVTAVAGGSANITVTTQDGAKTVICAVTVSNAVVPVTGVTVSPATLTLVSGNTSQLTATVAPANTTNKTVSWTTSNAAVATVNASGLVTAVATGTAIITVTTQDGARTANCAVTVTPSVANLALNKPITASSSEGILLATNANDGNAGTRWSSLFSDPQWIRIDLLATYAINRVVLNWEAAAGKSFQIQTSNDDVNWTSIYSTTTSTGGIQSIPVTGTGRYIRVYGTARTTAYGYSLFEYEVYGGPVTNIPVTSVTLIPATVSLTIGGTTQLTATVLPSNATNKAVSYSTSNAAVATVNASGVVLAVGAGSATITVTTQDGAKKASSTITVTGSTVNLALNKTATSSTFEGAYTAAMANDGNAGTRWGSAFADPQWITVDLQNSFTIAQVVLTWETASAKAFQIQTSTDNTNWTNIYTTTTSTGGVQIINVTGQGRYIRIYGTVRNTAWGYSLFEIEVYSVKVKTTDSEFNSASSLSDNLRFYPNPVSNQLNIEFDWKEGFNSVSLYDFTGKLVASQIIETDAENLIFDVQTLKSGVYIVKLNGVAESKTFKVIKE